MNQFIQLMAQHPLLFAGFSFVFAATIGSFINVVIHRFPVMLKRQWQQECNQYLDQYHRPLIDAGDISTQLKQPIDPYPKKYNLIVPTSACPHCQINIKPWHNLPILGWLLVRGRCRGCNARISSRYIIVEAITGLSVAYLGYHFGPSWQFVFAAILTFGLIALSGIDFDEMLLPDQFTLPLLWLGLLVNVGATFSSLTDAVIGAAMGYMSLWCVFWLFKLLTGKEGMGYGDFKLLAVIGAWLGWQMLPLVIMLSSICGVSVGLTMMLSKRHRLANPIPFGPYIAIAGWVALVWGNSIVNAYLAMLS